MQPVICGLTLVVLTNVDAILRGERRSVKISDCGLRGLTMFHVGSGLLNDIRDA